MIRRAIASAALLALLAGPALASGRTSWTAGAGVGYTWTAAFASGDLTSMPSGDAVLSNASAITNQTAQDIFADISVIITIGSATPTAGAFIAIYVVPLAGDGSTYGDGSYTAGTQKALQPPQQANCVIPLQSTNATTTLSGTCTGVVIPPGTFRFMEYNDSSITYSATAGNNKTYYRAYDQQLNAQ